MVDQRRKHGILRRTRREWLARGALALSLAALGAQAVTASLAHAVARVDPQQAALLSPGDGHIMAKAAESGFRQRPDISATSRAAAMARQALRLDPTAAEAVAVLGFQAQLRGELEKADQLFSYATRLTRRELQPRIWAIERAVERGDIDQALRNYDVALRTSDAAKDMLFPILAAALAEPRIRGELARILNTRPVWEDDFIAFAAIRGVEPEGAIALISEAPGLQVNDDLRAHLVNALAAKDKPEEAWAFYRSFRPTADRSRSRDPNFALRADQRAVFDWRPGDHASLSVATSEGDRGGVLDFNAPPGSGGVLVSQTQLLPAGSYRLEGRSSGLNQPANSRPYWTLSCENGQELGRIVMPNSEEDHGRFAGRFTVPSACPVQILALIARPTDKIAGVSGSITHAQLQPDD